MVLPSSGPLSLNSIAGEFGGSTPHGLDEYYRVANSVPVSGAISIGDFYGKSVVPSYGYWSGFYYLRTDVFKITYSTDTTSSTRSAVIAARTYMQATGNASDGYFIGGTYASIRRSYTDRITYATDTKATLPALRLIRRWAGASTSSATNGYVGGGSISGSNYNTTHFDKINYATTTKTTYIGYHTHHRHETAAAETATAGYWTGGADRTTPSTIYHTSVERLTYSTETASLLPGANFPREIYHHAGTGNLSFGYFGGGTQSGGGTPQSFAASQMYKMTYSTNTTAFSPSSFLSAGRYGPAATGNRTNGYFAGGNEPGPTFNSARTDKIVFSTGTRSTSPSIYMPLTSTDAAGT